MPKAKKVVRKLPKFESEDQERQFWATHDSTEYVNWRQGLRL
jgi:CopG antitoxin of type II toxin-antitoxin system